MSSGILPAAWGLLRVLRNSSLTPCGIIKCINKHSYIYGADRFAFNMAWSARA